MVLKMAGFIGKDEGAEAEQGKFANIKQIFIGLLAACIIVLFVVPQFISGGATNQVVYGDDYCPRLPYDFNPHTDAKTRLCESTGNIEINDCKAIGGSPDIKDTTGQVTEAKCIMPLIKDNPALNAVGDVSGTITGIAQQAMTIIGVLLGVGAAACGLVMRVNPKVLNEPPTQ